MATRDSRNNRQGWDVNPLISQSASAVRQAAAPFMDWAKLMKNTVNKFNDNGRPDNVSDWEDFQCIIEPDGTRTRTLSAGGTMVETKYTVMYLNPVELQMDNVLWHKTFGYMKITGFDGLARMGITTAEAVGMNGAFDVEDGEVARNVQEELF